VQDHAAALEALIGSSGAREGLGGSAFQTASNGYFDKWMELGTAFRATSSSILSSRRAANSERDDASEERLGEISAMVQVADTFGAAVSTVQGNVNALQSQVSMWQSTMTPATVHVNDNGQIAINHAEVTGPNVQENLESYIGPAANSGGAIIKFIFDAEIRRCEAAVAAVAAHDASFDRIVGNNDLKARGEALVNAMNALKTQAIAMSDEAEIMRREHLDFGARIDEENEEAGLIGAGEEQAVQYTAELATIREAATYTSNALRMSQTTRVSAVGMRDRISAYQRGRHATSDLQSAANRSNMDDEHDRYRGAWRVTQSLEGALGRRAEHLTELAAHYTDAMGNLSSTDGQDRY
jgi:biopolymer transport protein ExbD